MPTTLDRTVGRLFSTAVFREVLAGKSTSRADDTVAQIRAELALEAATNSAVVRAAYEVLSDNYRSEYFYKNLIVSKIFIGRHRATNSVLLNEFRIGNSVADCVLVNGKGVVYEIKTEFDSPHKLESQLSSYYEAFPYVNVVVNELDAERYLRRLGGTPAGLLTVGRRGRLSSVKPAEAQTSEFDLETMYRSMRLSEIVGILEDWFGSVPDVPNGVRYEKYLALAREIPVQAFQREMQGALKSRALRSGRDLLFDEALRPLRAMVVQLNPDAKQRDKLLDWLQLKEI